MKLFFRRYGNGQPYVILHGMFEMSDNWVGFARFFSGKYNVILPDLRNHGQSPHSDVHTNRAMAQDLKELFDDLGIKRTILQGYSMGGRVAMTFAHLYPAMVEKLILIDISPGGLAQENIFKGNIGKQAFEQIANLDLSQFPSRRQIENYLGETLPNALLVRIILKNIKHSQQGFTWKFNLKAIKEYYERLDQGVLPPDARINVSTLLVRGENGYVQAGDLELMRKIFPNLQVKTIKGTTHFLPVENPAALITAISEFLGQ